MTLEERAGQHGPVSVIVPVSDQLRQADFVIDLCSLVTPPDSKILMVRSASITENLNMALHDMPDHHTHAFILGDDHVFPHDLLIQLLEHNADVVVPLCIKRTPPYLLGIFKEQSTFHDERLGRDYPGYLPYNLHEVPDQPFHVVASGSAGMLIRRTVLDDIGYPYFESSDGVYLNEDLQLCSRLRDKGYQILCDPHAYLGHIGTTHIWPEWRDGMLMVKLDHGGKPGENEVFIGAKPRVAAAAAA